MHVGLKSAGFNGGVAMNNGELFFICADEELFDTLTFAAFTLV